jgi:hypothetical protein
MSSKFSKNIVFSIACVTRILNGKFGTKMTRKPECKPDDPKQSKRFIEIAKEVEADDAKALDSTFNKIASEKKKQGSK